MKSTLNNKKENDEDDVEMSLLNDELQQHQREIEEMIESKVKKSSFDEFDTKSYITIIRLFYTVYLLYLILRTISILVFIDSTKNQIVYTLIAIYLGLLILNFSFLVFCELRELKYRLLHKHYNNLIVEKKVDLKLAETSLKDAIHKSIEKERIENEIKLKVDKFYESIKRLRNVCAKMCFFNAITTIISTLVVSLLTYNSEEISFLDHYFLSLPCILPLYVMYPFKLNYMTLPIGIAFSILVEYFNYRKNNNILWIEIIIKILVHASVHTIGVYLSVHMIALKENTFLNITKMYLINKSALEDEKNAEIMIKSIMPPLFTNIFGKPEEFRRCILQVNKMRPLYVYPISSISILFADIVGFTDMSSNKTAQQLVFLLNDLYGRFDRLCEKLGCEKISTLGDCYYCVSGCLNERQDHAKCCVEMGLSMIKEIQEFNRTHSVDINMRVGVHTGKALCGFIGGKRFRFDVWSSDVKYANQMESTGKAGRVHISNSCFKQLSANEYKCEPGDKYVGEQTYFVIADEQRKLKQQTVADAVALSKQKVNELSNINNSHVQSEPKDDISQKAIEAISAKQEVVEFFLPDVNLFTFKFKSQEVENEYNRYLVGLSYNECDNSFNNLMNHRNSQFIALLISFIINFFIFISMLLLILNDTSFKLATYPYVNILFLVYLLVITGQMIFLTVYLCKFTSFFKQNRKLTGLFDTETRIGTNLTIKLILFYVVSLLHLITSPLFILIIGTTYVQHTQFFQLFITYLIISFCLSLLQFCLYIKLNTPIKCAITLAYSFVFTFFACYGIRTHENQTYFVFNSIAQNYKLIIWVCLSNVLIYLVSCHYELIHRLCFKYKYDTYKQIETSKEKRDLANWLYEVVLPAHVINVVKEKKQYSKNYDCVGVIFVSLCNFSEFYEEMFLDGREFLRILNEITIDIDLLFDDPKFKNIEKIKTIGPAFMLASGLTEEESKDGNQQHLLDLLEFASELSKKMERFNEDAMSVCNFKFQMRMGLNYGPVTAGIIGEDRLLYDIWGDTVNVASRMESTGQANLLQMPEYAKEFYETHTKIKFFDGKLRRIKGRGDLFTYFTDPKQQ